VIPFTFPTYVQGDGTIACRAKVITDTTGLVRWIDYTPIKFVASMTNMGTTNNDGSQAIELITQTTGLVKGIDYIVVYVDSSATVPWSTNANGYIPCYSAPYSLFASSEQGVWYDPSDFSTLFQDSAGTTPVTAVEQPVGKMLDKSGRGNHATQSTAGNRPVLQQDGNGCYYLAFNGTNSSMNVNYFAIGNSWVIHAGVISLSASGDKTIFTQRATGVDSPVNASLDVSNGIARTVRRNDAAQISNLNAGTMGVSAKVLTASYTAGNQKLILNGAIVASGSATIADPISTTNTTIGYSNNIIVGAYFNGNLYSLIVRGAQSSAAQITSAETYVNGKTVAW